MTPFHGLALVFLLVAQEPVSAESEALQAPIEAPQMAPSCDAWLLEQVGSVTHDPASIETALTKNLDSAPDLPCRLRALFLAAEQESPNAESLLRRGEALALEGLRARPGWENVAPDDVRARLSTAGPEENPLLFWFAYLWGHRLEYESSIRAGLDIRHVTAILEYVARAAPETYAGGAMAFLGAYYASLPIFFGRDTKKSRAFFALALQQAQGNLARSWTFAQCCLKGNDKKAYRVLIEEIASKPLTPDQPYYLESFLAQADAKTLLGRKNDE